MSELTGKVLARLASLGFQTRVGGLAPFDEALPLVTGVAWDTATAQFAIVAELQPDDSDEAWTQLLFAASGLRHQVAGDGPAAFGAPIVLAIVDEEGERRLRDLSEGLAEQYALFNRVDLNLMRNEALGDQEALDVALAPLLPKCRKLLGKAISREDVRQFWDVLRDEVGQAALALDDRFGPYRQAAGRDSADHLIGESPDAEELPAPWPVRVVELSNFRSFVGERVELAPITIIHGPNGGGKTSIVEALELAWAARSQRHPPDVQPDEYARHLPRDGVGEFKLTYDDRPVGPIAALPRAELHRCVLGQDTLDDLVGAPPDERYRLLLTATGLEIPDLAYRTSSLLDETKREADGALTDAGLAPLPRRDAVALRHLARALDADLTSRLPTTGDLVALQDAVRVASEGAFEGWAWEDGTAAQVLARAEVAVTGVIGGESGAGEVVRALDDARTVVEPLVTLRNQTAAGIRALLDTLSIQETQRPPADATAGRRAADTDLAVDVAVRWLSHGRSLTDTASRFREDASTQPERWATRLSEYADALEGAAKAVPRRDLDRVVEESSTGGRPAEPARPIDEAIYRGAGFTRIPADPVKAAVPLRELLAALERQADALMGLAIALERHPARAFPEHAPGVLRALCRYELARQLRRSGPVMRASETLVARLLEGRLGPVLRELVGAIVRFEWYFKPLQVPDRPGAIVISGLATPSDDLDARLVLNAAERSVVGIAWFLALHLLQPENRRRVLVLDDPTGALDMANQAGFVSTLRAFVRLTQPEQVIVTTHDDMLAAVLAEELAPVDGWPSSVARFRCQRDGHDVGRARLEWTAISGHATLEESERLGLGEGEATLFA